MAKSESSAPSAEHTFAGFETAWPEIRTLRNRTAFLTALIAVVLTFAVVLLATSFAGVFVLPALFFLVMLSFRGTDMFNKE